MLWLCFNWRQPGWIFHIKVISQYIWWRLNNFFNIYILTVIKGTWQWTNFLMFLHNSGQHRSLTLPFEPFRFWLLIRGDIHNRKSTPQLGESGSRWLPVSVSQGVTGSPHRWVGESPTPRLLLLVSDVVGPFCSKYLSMIYCSLIERDKIAGEKKCFRPEVWRN